MVINHNISALNTLNKLNANTKAAQDSLQKLSSGLRINSAADDAAGLAISQKMQAQINGLDQASSNAQDGISLIQTAEGSLSETQSILQRMNTLATQSASDTNTSTDRAAMQSEVSQLTTEIDRIRNTTNFNTRNLLDGSSGVQVTTPGTNISNLQGTTDTKIGTIAFNASGTDVNLAQQASVTGGSGGDKALLNASANLAFVGNSTIGIGGINYSFNNTTTTVQNALDQINANTASTGVIATWASGAGFTFKSSGSGSSADVNITAAGTGDFSDAANLTVKDVKGTDLTIGVGSATLTSIGGSYQANGNHVQITSGNYKGLQFDVSATTATTINVAANNSLNLQIGAAKGQTMSIAINDMGASALGVAGLDLSTQANASNAITTVNNAIATVSAQRATLGAYQNRLDHTINNLSTESQNLSSASSQITDVDMAAEMTNFTKNNILTQAAQAMLAQANQLPQGVLSLLK